MESGELTHTICNKLAKVYEAAMNYCCELMPMFVNYSVHELRSQLFYPVYIRQVTVANLLPDDFFEMINKGNPTTERRIISPAIQSAELGYCA